MNKSRTSHPSHFPQEFLLPPLPIDLYPPCFIYHSLTFLPYILFIFCSLYPFLTSRKGPLSPSFIDETWSYNPHPANPKKTSVYTLTKTDMVYNVSTGHGQRMDRGQFGRVQPFVVKCYAETYDGKNCQEGIACTKSASLYVFGRLATGELPTPDGFAP